MTIILANTKQVTTHLQFCLATSQIPLTRGGWFIDELSLFNEGGRKGAWFHGNFSGNYLPYAASEFIIPANLSSFPYLDELEINANWDIQGYLHDYLTVEFSFDNGHHGIQFLETMASLVWVFGIMAICTMLNLEGWVPIYLPIVHNFTNSGGLKSYLIQIHCVH